MTEPSHYEPPFYVRHAYVLKQWGAIFVIVLFFAAYHTLPFVGGFVDIVVDPAVKGLTVAYAKISGLVHKTTGINMGFLRRETNPEFQHRVELAEHVRQGRAGALVQIAVDQQESVENREEALRTLLKFSSSDDWIQPFLNELPRGGMLGLYDEKSPLLDQLFEKIRMEGGIQNTLVRAYAEVVFSFMLQVPGSPVVRIHALDWVNDALAEDAVFLLLPRIELEQDPAVQKKVAEALWKIRAVSDPAKARDLILPLYRNPAWPELRIPLAILMARLGYDPAKNTIRQDLNRPELTDLQRVDMRVALSGKSYPRELKITEREAVILAQRERARRRQQEEAKKKLALVMRGTGEEPEKEKTLDTDALLAYLDNTAPEPPESKPAPRQPKKETTAAYFEPVIENAPVFKEPSESSEAVNALHVGSVYRSTKSVKVDRQQWFYMENGWVRGTDIQLADSPD